MANFEIGQKVKAFDRKARGYIFGRVERIDERGNPFVRPEAYEGGVQFFMEYITKNGILTWVAKRDCSVCK